MYLVFFSLNDPSLAVLVMRLMVGTFFLLYRFRWFYDPTQPDPWFSVFRKERLEQRLCSCGYPQHPFMCGFIALAECLGGLGLVFGFMTSWAAIGLLVILAFATYCTAWENTAPQKPVDRLDVVSCYLRTIEPLYITLLVGILLIGPGAYSLDALIQGWAFICVPLANGGFGLLSP